MAALTLRSSIALIGLLCAASLAATPSASLPTADEAWAQLVREGVVDYKTPDNYRTMTARSRSDWNETRAYLVQVHGLTFLHQYPSDPRRWRVVSAMIANPPWFIVSYGPKFEADGRDVVSNETARAAWREVLQGLLGQMRRATDVPEGVLETTLYGQCVRAAGAAERTAEEGNPVNWEQLFSEAESFAREFPAGRLAPYPLRSALTAFGRAHLAAESHAMFARYANHPNADVAEFVQSSLRALDLATTPMELKFTALDGRAVDLAKLRGKVVLVDFWATWCGPCKAELPNVKNVYTAYHDRGFEVIGISLDKANDRQKLADYCREHDLPWPQHFDGKYWKNELAVKYAITGIPAMFLFGPDGKLVTTNARGPKLEAEVKRLLKL